MPEQPIVSVIVPARNEEACLGSCLQSLTTQEGVNSEIIVVDDGSTDHTRAIAQSFPMVRVIDPDPLPPGWVGKNNALVAGAREAKGEWLLFTDADTVHLAGSLSRALNEARQRGAALLSYSPEQEVHGFWEKAVMAVIFAELATVYRATQVSDPGSPAAAANGQYLLVSREAYHAVGGHAAIAGNLLEDVAMARAVKKSGRRIWFRYGGDIVRARMYRSFAQLREGWTKNLVLLFPTPLRLATLRIIEFLLILGGAATALVVASRGHSGVGVFSGAVALVTTFFFIRRIGKAHFRWSTNVFALLGLPIFSYLLLRSTISYRQGKVTWKGRVYAAASPDVAPEALSARTRIPHAKVPGSNLNR